MRSLLILPVVTLLTWASPVCGQPPAHERAAVLPGEFERQAAVLLAWDAEERPLQNVLVDIVRAVRGRVQVILLVADEAARAHAAQTLREAGVDPDSLRLVTLSVDSVWARDYGPLVTVANGRLPKVIDPEHPRTDRMHDNLVPSRLARRLRMPSTRIPILIEGGNLLSNGDGLIIATEALLEENDAAGYRQEMVEQFLRRDLGAREVVFLERLIGEESGHVDMFATFAARDTVIVGAYDPDEDPINSAVLDRNAFRLSRVSGSTGRLKVIRIPMGRRDFDICRTYTNVFYANGTLLLPTYPKIDPDGEAAARRVYRRVLPAWEIVGIDCSRLIEWGGGLHCVTASIARVPRQERVEESQSRRVQESEASQTQRSGSRLGDASRSHRPAAINRRGAGHSARERDPASSAPDGRR